MQGIPDLAKSEPKSRSQSRDKPAQECKLCYSISTVRAVSGGNTYHPAFIRNLSGLEISCSHASQALLGFTQHEITANTACLSQQFISLQGAINSYFIPTRTFLLVMSLGSLILMTSMRGCLALTSQQSFQRTVFREGIPASHKKPFLYLAASLLSSIKFCSASQANTLLSAHPASPPSQYTIAHGTSSLLLLQITQKLCTFYQQRKLNTSIHCFFHAWLHTSLLLLLTVCIAEGAVGEEKKKVTFLLLNSLV